MKERSVEMVSKKEETIAAPPSIVEFPKYRSHKVVHALKIGQIEQIEPGKSEAANLIPVEGGFPPIYGSPEYMNKHNPQVGGYYVVYEDGYESWSPAEAFEAGYDLIVDEAEGKE